MKEYHKIQTVYKRDLRGNIILGDWSLPEFDYLQYNIWVGTEKVDGTNIRVIYNHFTNEVKFGAKTDNAHIPVYLYDRLNLVFKDKIEILKTIFSDCDVCLYGEGYGAKIQKGGGNYKSDGVDFVLFDVKIGNWWLKRQDVEDISKKLNIDIVPIVFNGNLQEGIEMVQKGIGSTWGNFLSEGMVLRPKVELQTRNGDRLITKIKHRDFK